VKHKRDFRKTHELGELCYRCVQIDSSFELIAPIAVNLNPYAVEARYPGIEATQEDAKNAIRDMKDLRKFIRARMELK